MKQSYQGYKELFKLLDVVLRRYSALANIDHLYLGRSRGRQKAVSDWLTVLVLLANGQSSKLTNIPLPYLASASSHLHGAFHESGCYHTGRRSSHCTTSCVILFELTAQRGRRSHPNLMPHRRNFLFLINLVFHASEPFNKDALTMNGRGVPILRCLSCNTTPTISPHAVYVLIRPRRHVDSYHFIPHRLDTTSPF